MNQPASQAPNLTKTHQPLLDYYPANDDGYTLQAYYKPVPQVHGPIRIKFRPTQILDRAALLEMRNTSTEQAFSMYLSRWMQKRIVGWSLRIVSLDGEMVPMPITVENILMLKPPLWKRIVDTVCWGFDGGDEDPDAPKTDERKADAERVLEAMIAKQPVVDNELATLQKN